jgi:hypothetical protein
MKIVVRDPVEYLRQFLAQSQDGQRSPQDVVYVLKTMAREILPGAGFRRNQCPQLELFADWAAHNEIDRAQVGRDAVAAIAEAIPLHGSDAQHDNKWIEEVLNGAISFGGLRLDLLAVCRHFGLPDGLFTTIEAWNRFAFPLAFELSGRRVLLGNHRPTADRISRAGLPADHQPQSLMIQLEADDNGKPLWAVKTNAATIYIQVLFGGFRPSDFPTPQGWQSPLGIVAAPPVAPDPAPALGPVFKVQT